MFLLFFSLNLSSVEPEKFVDEIDRYYYQCYYEEDFQEWFSEVLFEKKCLEEIENELSEVIFYGSQKIVDLIHSWDNPEDLIESDVVIGSNLLPDEDLKKVFCFFYDTIYQDTEDYEKIARINYEYDTKKYFFEEFEYRYPEYCKNSILEKIEEEHFSKIKQVLREADDNYLREELYPLIKHYPSFKKWSADTTFSSDRISLLTNYEIEPMNALEEAVYNLCEEIDQEVDPLLEIYIECQDLYDDLLALDS